MMGKETIRWNDRLLKNYYTCEVLLLVLAFPFWRVSFSCWQKTMYFGIRCKCTFYLLSGLLFFYGGTETIQISKFYLLYKRFPLSGYICRTNINFHILNFQPTSLLPAPVLFDLFFFLFSGIKLQSRFFFNLSQFPKFQQLLKIANLSR